MKLLITPLILGLSLTFSLLNHLIKNLKATREGFKEIVELLVDKECNIDDSDEEGKTALHWG